MTTPETRGNDVLIFAVDESAHGVGAELIRLTGDQIDWGSQAFLMVDGPGEALRLIYRHEPRLLFVCVARVRLDESAAMIDALRQRRPQIPLLAIAAEHDESIERAVRSAGAVYYFALDDEADPRLLRSTLELLDHAHAAPPDDARVPYGPAPPQQPPARRLRISLNTNHRDSCCTTVSQNLGKDQIMSLRNLILRRLMLLALALLFCVGSARGQTIIFNFDEKGIGTVQSNAANPPIPLISLGNVPDLFDPGNGMQPLAYNIVGTLGTAPIDGDITLFDPQNTAIQSDLLRFYHGFLYVYSDLAEPGDPQSAADVGLPVLRQQNAISLFETGVEPGPNGLYGYTPAAGGPGEVSAPSVYNFTSDQAVPEPNSLALLGLSAFLLLRRKR